MRGLAVIVLVVLAGVPEGLPAQERTSNADKNSVELTVRGCLKGRELTAVSISETDQLPLLSGAVFRLSGKGEVDRSIKSANGRFVEAAGLVKKTAFAEPGFKVGGARIVIGGGQMRTDPTRNPARNSKVRIFPMDVTSLTLADGVCEK